MFGGGIEVWLGFTFRFLLVAGVGKSESGRGALIGYKNTPSEGDSCLDYLGGSEKLCARINLPHGEYVRTGDGRENQNGLRTREFGV